MQKTIPDSDIIALVKLIENEEEDKAELLKQELALIVKSDPERIETLLNRTIADNIPTFVSALIEESKWAMLEKMFSEFISESGNCNLEQGLFLISKFAYPEISFSETTQQLNALAEAIKIPQEELVNPIKPVELINRHLFETSGFKSCDPQVQSSQHIFLSNLLANKEGTAVSLSSLYMLVARRLGIETAGIALPGHFITSMTLCNDNVIIDPQNGGRVMSPRECRTLVSARGIHWDKQFLTPVTDQQILELTLSNLIYAYNREKEPRRAEQVKKYLDIIRNRG